MEKFRKLTRYGMPADQQEEAIDIIRNMEKVDDMARLPRALQGR